MPRRQKRFDRKGKSSIEGFEGDVNSRAVGEAKKIIVRAQRFLTDYIRFQPFSIPPRPVTRLLRAAVYISQKRLTRAFSRSRDFRGNLTRIARNFARGSIRTFITWKASANQFHARSPRARHRIVILYANSIEFCARRW